MKKHILFVFLFMFLFINGGVEVKAATELSCLYEKEWFHDKVMLIQKESGEILIYVNEKDADYDGSGWKLFTRDKPRWNKYQYPVIKDGSLTVCPYAVNTANIGVPSKRFSEKFSVTAGEKLEEEGFGIESLETITVDTVDESEILSKDIVDADSGRIKSCDVLDSEGFFLEHANEILNGAGNMASCVYALDYNNSCHIVRMAITNNKKYKFSEIHPEELNGNSVVGLLQVESDFVYEDIISDYGGVCPATIEIFRKENVIDDNNNAEYSYVSHVQLNSENPNYLKYPIRKQAGNNLLDGSELTSDVEINIDFEKIEFENCEDLFGDSPELLDLLKSIINLFKILIPIILIGLGILDFAKAIFAGSEDVMKKAQSKFIKRVLIAVAIFLVPSLLKLVLSIADNIWNNIDPNLCGLL